MKFNEYYEINIIVTRLIFNVENQGKLVTG
jgi:hypothetical protein